MKKDRIVLAANALSDLNVFNAIVGMLECGSVSPASYKVASQIVRICGRHQMTCLRRYDEHREALNEQA